MALPRPADCEHTDRPRLDVVHLVNNAAPRPHRLGQWGAAPSVGPDGVVTYPPDPAPAAGSP